MFEQILLTVDGSGRSREMMNVLLALPSLKRTQITILHVIPGQTSSESVTEYRLAGERILEKERSSLRVGSDNGSSITTLLKEGDPKDIVCKVADELKPDLIIMGSRGMGRLQSILANSVSQYVFQLASAPMLLIKDDVYIKSLRRVMVAVDNTSAAQQCLDSAIALVNGYKVIEILLIRVLKQKDDTVTSATEPTLAQASAKLKKFNIPHQNLLRLGSRGKEMCKAVEETGTSLLMLASPDRRPSIARSLPDLDRLLGGSVSDYVRVNASCPVLLTRPIAE